MKIRLFVRLLVAVTFLMNTIAAQIPPPEKRSYSATSGLPYQIKRPHAGFVCLYHRLWSIFFSKKPSA